MENSEILKLLREDMEHMEDRLTDRIERLENKIEGMYREIAKIYQDIFEIQKEVRAVNEKVLLCEVDKEGLRQLKEKTEVLKVKVDALSARCRIIESGDGKEEFSMKKVTAICSTVSVTLSSLTSFIAANLTK